MNCTQAAFLILISFYINIICSTEATKCSITDQKCSAKLQIKNTSNDFLIILISFSAVFLIIFGIELFINGLLYSSGIMRDENPENDNVVYISSLLFRGSTVVIIILYCRFLEGRPVCSMGLRKKNFFIHYISGLIVGAVMVSASILILKYLGAVSITPCEKVNYMYNTGFACYGLSRQ